MKISLNDWENYRNLLAKINNKAAEEFRDHFFTVDGGLSAFTREEMIEYAYALCTKYGEASAELACMMYDEIAAAEGVAIEAAVPAETATAGEVGKAINGALKQSPSGQLLDSVVYRLVKQPAADTMLQNAKRDGAQFAWIPSGDTCAFCNTLASRGWQYQSKKTLKNGHAEHIHANCDCQYVVRFNSDTTVEGYDPEALYENYMSYDGKPNDKINAMRREAYAQNKERINAQKREAYAIRTGKEEV